MTNIKKLFLTLSLLAMQSAFGMDPVTKKARTDDSDEWTPVTTNQALAQHAGKIIASGPMNAINPPFTYYFVEPTPHELTHRPDDNLYILYACERGPNPRTFNFSLSNRQLTQYPLLVRRLLFEEADDLHNGIESKDILVNDEILSIEDGYTGELVPVLPNEGRDLFKISFLTKKAQIAYAVQRYLKFPKTLLGIRRFRQSALSVLHKDMVPYICKLAIADALRNDIPLEFE